MNVIRTLTMIILFATPAISADLENFHEAAQVNVYEPVVVPHGSSDQVSVMNLESRQELPEQAFHRGNTETVFVARPGTYLVSVGQQYGIVTVMPPSPEPDPAPDATIAKVEKKVEAPATPEGEEKTDKAVWVYVRDNCPPCDEFKRKDLPTLRANDIAVYFVDDPHDKSTPTFIIQAPGKPVVERVGRQDGWTDAKTILAYMDVEA